MAQETQKMTPVEWLALRYHHRQGYLSQDDIAEAKAMEIENLEDCWIAAEQSEDSQTFFNYYNETYNK
jgi:hypothetical protein